MTIEKMLENLHSMAAHTTPSPKSPAIKLKKRP